MGGGAPLHDVEVPTFSRVCNRQNSNTTVVICEEIVVPLGATAGIPVGKSLCCLSLSPPLHKMSRRDVNHPRRGMHAS